MRRILFLTLFSTFLLLGTAGDSMATLTPAPTPSMKIGYVDLDYVFSFLPEIKKVESECASFEKQLQNQLEAKIREFQQKLQDLQQGYETMDEPVRNQKQQELQELEKNLKRLQLESQEKLMSKRNSLLSPIDAKIRSTIKQIAEENGYIYILNASLGGMPVILYVVEEHNISDLILKKLGISPEKEKDSKEASKTSKGKAAGASKGKK